MPTIAKLASKPLQTFLCVLEQRNGEIVRMITLSPSRESAQREAQAVHRSAKFLSVHKLVSLEKGN